MGGCCQTDATSMCGTKVVVLLRAQAVDQAWQHLGSASEECRQDHRQFHRQAIFLQFFCFVWGQGAFVT